MCRLMKALLLLSLVASICVQLGKATSDENHESGSAVALNSNSNLNEIELVHGIKEAAEPVGPNGGTSEGSQDDEAKSSVPFTDDDDDEQEVRDFVENAVSAAEFRLKAQASFISAPSPIGADIPDGQTAEVQVPTAEHKFTLMTLYTGRYYQRIYDKINKDLVEQVPSEASEPNMVKAIEWWQSKAKSKFVFSKQFAEALDQFTQLSRIPQEHHCTWESFVVLFKNDQATGQRTHKPPSEVGPFRRIDRIVHRYALQHAIECHKRYPVIFRTIIAEMNYKAIERTKHYLFEIIAHIQSRSRGWLSMFEPPFYKPVDVLEFVRQAKSLGDKQRAATIAYETIWKFAHEEKDPDLQYLGRVVDEKSGKLVMNGTKLQELFKRYIVEPCEYYIGKLGPNVFVPAKYDTMMLEKEDRYKVHEDEEFAYAWLRFRLCYVVHRNQELLADDLVSMAHKLVKRLR